MPTMWKRLSLSGPGRRLAFLLVVVAVLMLATASRGTVVFDNISNFESSAGGAGVTAVGSTPNYFMGDGYMLLPGTTNITGIDAYPVNLTGTTFTGLQINIYIWGNVNTGTVNSGSPAFANLLGSYSYTVGGSFPSGFYYPFESSPAGSAPGITLPAPLAITGTNVGVTFNYQGTTDGVNYVSVNSLSPLVAYGTAPTTGGQMFNGYFRNASSEQDGNFISSLRSLGLTFQSIALRVYGGVAPSYQPPVATSQSADVRENSSVNITLAGTDSNGNPLSYTVVTGPTNGVLTGSAPNLTYTPATNFLGTDAFNFKVNDGVSDSSPATVSLTVLKGAGLVINPVWDSTILNDPNVVAITNTIIGALQVYEANFANPVTVTITYAEMSSGLGQSQTYIGTIPYASFYQQLAAGAKTTNDAVALAHITSGPNNPVNGSANITLTTANLRALGFASFPPGGASDSTVSLNMSLINITRPGANPSFYDLKAVVSHETDEVLGSGSGVGDGNVEPQDLWRYSSGGALSFTTAGDDAYFSLDGTTDLARQNQNSQGDYGDFWSIAAHTPVRVQDAFGTPGSAPDLGVELTLLDVIGWDLVNAIAVPPIVVHASLAGNVVNLSWNSAADVNYQLQYTTNLAGASWINLGNSIIASSTNTATTDVMTGNKRRFYRVAVVNNVVPLLLTAPQTAAQAVATIPLGLKKHVTLPRPDGNGSVVPGTPKALTQAAGPDFVPGESAGQ